MLHVLTSHTISPRWIEIQTRHLRQHISVPFQTWASIQLIDPAHGAHFDRIVDQKGAQAGKLNHLAVEVLREADEDDLLMFLDGDAFPVADPMPRIEAALETAPLIAVRRAESAGDPQPHPCFCVTSAASWRRLAGDWSDGYVFSDERGRRVTGLGANLLRRLELTGTPWVQLLRSNPTRLDPLFFAIYGEIVYHHGAGEGGGLSRAHRDLAPAPGTRLPLPGAVAARLETGRRRLWERRVQRRYLRHSEELHARIARGDPDWLADVRR